MKEVIKLYDTYPVLPLLQQSVNQRHLKFEVYLIYSDWLRLVCGFFVGLFCLVLGFFFNKVLYPFLL